MELFNEAGELVSEAKDVLYEIGNVGVATAVVAIGNIREMEIRLGTPHVFVADTDVYSRINYNPEQVVVGVTTQMKESFKGSILFLLSMEFVHNTVEFMMGQPISVAQLSEDEECASAIREMINYMTAGYVKVLGEYLNEPIFISSPVIGIEPVKDILGDGVDEIQKKHGNMACIDIQFSMVNQDGEMTDEKGQVLIFPDDASIDGLLRIAEEETQA